MAGHPGRVTTSRLEIVSSTSNWPNVDEEALLREQATPELLRVSSAPASKHSRDSVRRSATLPSSAKEVRDLDETVVNFQGCLAVNIIIVVIIMRF